MFSVEEFYDLYNNQLPQYHDGLSVVYYDTDYEPTCHTCANKWHEYSTELIAYDLVSEDQLDDGEPIICTNCYKTILSAD